MQVSKSYFMLAALALFAACTPRPQTMPPQQFSIIGSWEALDIAITPDFMGGSKKTIVQAAVSNPKMGKLPAKTFIEPSGTFREEQWKNADSLLVSRKGYWHQHEDSLFWRYADSNTGQASFGVELERNHLKLSTIVDFDGDKQKDDLMVIQMQRK